MSTLTIACLWCVLQVSLLSAVGVAMSLLIVRRYPASSAAVMSATTSVVLLATLLLPIQIPSWALPQIEIVEASKAAEAIAGEDTSDSEPLLRDKPGAAFVDLHAILSRFHSVVHRDAAIIATPNLAIRCVTAMVGLSILLGTIRLGIAFFAVWRIRRGCVPVDGGLATNQMKAIAEAMQCSLPVRLAMSPDVQSAAVAGWVRPLVVLPTDWKTWPVEQLQAVLAHELAHVVRRDYLWRAIGAIARAIHYYHPLAHWSLGRLAYSQEVAADQLAAQTLGSRAKYLKALSHLAIRQDDLLRLHPEPILLPTSSSHLIRRINMLRTKERTQSRGANLVVRAIAVSAVVLLAVVSTALRGLAEPADVEPTTPTAQTGGVQNSTDQMFKYPPIDPAIIGDNEHGIFVLRVGEILKRESVKPMIGALNQMASAACKSWFGSPELVEFDLEMIDYVVGQAEVKIKRVAPTPKSQHTSQLMFGSNYWVVRFNRDISSWQQWIRKNAPAAEELQHGEITYFQLPIIPALGPQRLSVAARDSHTLVFALDGENFWQQVNATNTVRARWTDEWKDLDGGLFSLIATDKSIEHSVEESSTPNGNAINQVVDNIQQLGYAIDWDDLTNQFFISMQFSCSNPVEADLVETGIDLAMTLGRDEAETELEKADKDDSDAIGVFRLRSEMIDNIETKRTVQPDGALILNLDTSFTWTLEEIFGDLLPGKEEVASREPVSTTTK